MGNFPVEILPLDCDAEAAIVGGLIRELNDCYCLSMPPTPALCRGKGSPLDEPEFKKLIMVGGSHTSRISALVSASIETICFKLPNQSQTNAEQKILLLANELSKLGLAKGDCVYIDALSNQLFMGSDEDGLPTEPERDGDGKWHITGSLVAAPKPRLKKLLLQLSPLREACGEATLVCSLPLSRADTSPANAVGTRLTLRTVETRTSARSSARPYQVVRAAWRQPFRDASSLTP